MTVTARVTAASVRADLEKAFKRRHITVDPGAAADLALTVVLPHLQKMSEEIRRLRGQVAAERALAGKDGSEGEKRRG